MQGKWKKGAQGTSWSDRNIVSCFLKITNIHKIVKAQGEHSRSMWFLLINHISLKLKWMLKKIIFALYLLKNSILTKWFLLLENVKKKKKRQVKTDLYTSYSSEPPSYGHCGSLVKEMGISLKKEQCDGNVKCYY